MILLFGNIVDACVIKTEISEMKSSIGVVSVRSLVPLFINMSCGCPDSWLISSQCKIVPTCVIVGDLQKVKSSLGGKRFLLSRNFPLESHRKMDLWTTAGGVLTGRTLLSRGLDELIFGFDLVSQCLIGILPRHQSGTKELWEACAFLWSQSLKRVFPGEKRNEGVRRKNPRAGHVTPSFMTVDEEGF